MPSLRFGLVNMSSRGVIGGVSGREDISPVVGDGESRCGLDCGVNCVSSTVGIGDNVSSGMEPVEEVST